MGYLQMLLAPWGFSGWLLLKLIELLLLPFLILLRLFITRSHSPIDTPKPREQLSEETRLAECREVVLGFAHTMGYIAREVISRQELEEKIDRGISATDLAAEIGARITAFPGIILGQDRNLPVPVKLPQTYRNRHTYIIGKSGSGKTNFLRNMMSQDIADGAGIAVLAPEQELLTDELLPYIPDHRIDDVVYVNPTDIEYPIPFNPLYLDEGDDIDLAVDDLLTIFGRVSGDVTPRMREILNHTFYALLEKQGSTLLDVEILLDRQESGIRDEIIRTTDNPRTARFFKSTFPSLSRDACLPIITRIGQLISPKRVQTLLCQPGKSFNFREAMDDGKILLFNLSDGILGVRDR